MMRDPLGNKALEDLLLDGSRERWCASLGCTTCGSPELSGILAEHPGLRPPSLQRALRIARELAAVDHDRLELRMEAEARVASTCNSQHVEQYDLQSRLYWCRQAVMWLIYRLWRQFGDDAHNVIFPVLAGSWAGSIYDSMRSHYAGTGHNRVGRPDVSTTVTPRGPVSFHTPSLFDFYGMDPPPSV
jgi:hypothetical protein